MAWEIDNSKLVYGLDQDDLHFLKISDTGDLMVKIHDVTIPVEEILDQVSDLFPMAKYSPSFTLRMPQLITTQINKLLSVFDTTIKSYEYQGTFKPLYPIKVNQNKREVLAVMQSSQRYGLEAGTKSELFLILKMFGEHEADKSRIIMCNGVKDIDYIHIVKKALEDDYTIYISIESLSELHHALKYLAHDQLNLFFRIKPYVHMNGYWGKSAGRNSKFGLNIDDLVEATNILEEHSLQDRLLGIHAHPGSQVTDLESLSDYFHYMVTTINSLYEKGFTNLSYLNFGGGLPINYDGRVPDDIFSTYADTLLDTVTSNLGSGIKQPHIMIEAGRAVTALSSMLVIQPLHSTDIFPEVSTEEAIAIDHGSIHSVADIETIWKNASQFSRLPSFDELQKREQLVGVIKTSLRKKLLELVNNPDELDHPIAQELLAPDSYILGNFSVFNGACDYVMIGQYFPVIPTKFLNIQPETIIRLVDITCDSDGEISKFITKPNDSLDQDLFTMDGYPLTSEQPISLHGFPIGNKAEILDTYFVIPLVGAYQDIIEFDHNLIGDLPDIEVQVGKDDYSLRLTSQAQDIKDILKEVGYDLANHENPYISREDEEE